MGVSECLSFSGSSHYTTPSFPLIGPVWLGRLQCSDQAEILDQCTRSDWGASGCGHNRDVGVVCIPG